MLARMHPDCTLGAVQKRCQSRSFIIQPRFTALLSPRSASRQFVEKLIDEEMTAGTHLA